MSTTETNCWTLRPAKPTDLEAICDLVNDYAQAVTGVFVEARRGIEHTWNHPEFALEMDSRVAVQSDGVVVGYGHVQASEAPHVRTGGWLRVHPDATGRGIETGLLDWIEQRARERVDQAPPHARVILTYGFPDEDVRMQQLLATKGFSVSRHFWRMEIGLSAAIPTPQWPAGVSVRSFVLAEDLEAIVRVHQNAFSDHWGHVDVPFEQELEQWKTWIRNDPDFDETLTYLVVADDDVVGYASCDLKHPEDPAMGYIGILGVSRAWRRKGLALALLRHVFADFKLRGQHRVCLGVDSASLTGAVGLYEAAGMRSTRQTTVFETELRSGEDLSRRS